MGSEPRSLAAVSIRRAGAEDWPRLWPIWHEVVAAGDTYVYDPDTDSATAEARWVSTAARHELWLGEVDAAVLGMYKIAPNHEGPGGHVANGSYMVAAAARGLGVGRALVEHSLRRASELGFLAMQFNAVAESNVGAIMLYERLGFTTVGIVAQGFRHPQRGLIGLRIMHRTLL